MLADNPMHITPTRPAISLYFNPTHGTFAVLLSAGVIMMARYLLPHQAPPAFIASEQDHPATMQS